MKRIVVIFCLIGIWGILCASAGDLAISKLRGIKPGAENLNATIRAIAARGAVIYHYNDQYVLAGIPKSMGNDDWQWIHPRSAGQTLYLYSKIKASAPAEIAAHVDILADLGSELLIASDLDVTVLRGALRGSFTPLKLEAISIPDPSPRFEATKETSTDIQNLISQVSADSVLAFIQGMQDLQTRYALADNRLDVANWIKGQFLRFGITNASLQPFTWNNTTQYNVVATIEGTDYPDEYIVVGGHHDSITYTTPYVFAPGADDNASGSVAAIEMARVLMANNYQPKCSIRFVTFAA
ncbi:MAG TPA: M28 family peptidase, partial [Candidatus Cloacimonadota bacterium]|nr:M28 family peptidase [Candidatus Cloacimonadota bacterium]